ncbi:MAG TPA: hypothetical protein VG826_02135 [Pirellulales bacterium]|nr:hypothetical protein [Pirellulales bacterium]
MKAFPLRYPSWQHGVILTLLLLAAEPARAQQVRLPSPVDPQSPFYNPQSPAGSLTSQAQPATLQPATLQQGGLQPAATNFDPYADPANQQPAISPFTQPSPAGAQPYAAPGASPYAGIGQGNLAQPQYAQPAYGQPQFGQPIYGQPQYGQVLPDGTPMPRQRLLQEIHLDSTQLLRFGPHGLGIIDIGLDTVFAWPILANPNPVFITPGFTYHSWNGPASGNFAGSPDLPPNAYDAYLDTSWHPRVTNWFSADLDVRVGVYSDFSVINDMSVRILGRGLGIVTISPQWQVAAGIWYLNRLTVQLLPAGGVIWTPNQDTRFAILFPNPKLSHRMLTWGNTDIWGYLAGEYGGGRWTVRRADGASDVVELNDIRALAGLEWFLLNGIRGNMEIGYVFDRHIVYRSGTPTAHPSDTVLFRGGLTY